LREHDYLFLIPEVAIFCLVNKKHHDLWADVALQCLSETTTLLIERGGVEILSCVKDLPITIDPIAETARKFFRQVQRAMFDHTVAKRASRLDNPNS